MIVTPAIRMSLYLRSNGRCECKIGTCSCHAPGQRCPHDLDENWTVRHPTPDPDTLDNLVAVCQRCYQQSRPPSPGLPGPR